MLTSAGVPLSLILSLLTYTIMKEAKFDQDLYEELMEDEGCQYDPELYDEIAEYYLQA